MNKQISRVAILSLLLLTALIVATTYWQVWAAPGLAARQDNAIERVAQFRIKRGLIITGKTVLARNVAKKAGPTTLYFRYYPTNGFASQTVGYSTQGRARAGLERSQNAYLTAANANLGTIWSKLNDELKGTTVRGNNLVLNLRVGAQKIAQNALRGNCGAAVVLNPKTGAVYVMASSPTYNPNNIESPRGFAHIIHSPAACPGSAAPLLNRATAGLYSPGSTFKTVTAAAALDNGVYNRDSRFDDPGYCVEYGQKVSNALNPDQTAESYGNVDFLQAYEHSINAVFCNIGKTLGAKKVLDQAKKFGFYSKPPIELPASEVAASGLYNLNTAFAVRQRGHRRPGPARVRAGASARDASADGARCERRRQRRQDDGAPSDREGDLTDRQDAGQDETEALAAGDEAADGCDDERVHASGRQRRHGAGCGDPRGQGRR